MDGKNTGSPALPFMTRFVPVGCSLVRYGRKLACVERPADLWPAADACGGCFFRRSRTENGTVITCSDIQCSSFDRMDGKNVWFVEGEDVR